MVCVRALVCDCGIEAERDWSLSTYVSQANSAGPAWEIFAIQQVVTDSR